MIYLSVRLNALKRDGLNRIIGCKKLIIPVYIYFSTECPIRVSQIVVY